MPNYAQVTVIGHLGRDPELKYTQSGTAIVSCSIAVKTGYGDYAKTTWWNLTAFGKTAERFNDWTRKGLAVQVVGTPYLDTYTKQDGTQAQSLKVDVSDFTVLERRDDDTPQPQAQRQAPPANGQDIPF